MKPLEKLLLHEMLAGKLLFTQQISTACAILTCLGVAGAHLLDLEGLSVSHLSMVHISIIQTMIACVDYTTVPGN